MNEPRGLEHWFLLACALAGVLALVVLGVWIDPDPRGFGTHQKLGFPPCKPLEWWGIPCPGCGVTTSVSLAAHGQWWSSIQNQPFGFLVALALPAFALWAVTHHLRGVDLGERIGRMRLGRLALATSALLVASWLYKLALVRHWF